MKKPYGHNQVGEIVFVDDVERGLACECVCPLCQKPFRACQGDKNEHYFAHQDASECEFSYRASLLQMVVDFLESGELEIPSVIARYMSEAEVIKAGETVRFDRVEQVGDMQTPELHCHLGERNWILKPVFDKKDAQHSGEAYLTLDLTQFSNPYANRPHQNLKPALEQNNLLECGRYPGLEERERELREKHISKRFVPYHRQQSFRQSVNVRPKSPPRTFPSFKEESLPCKFCGNVTEPRDIFMTNKAEGYCVCRACNKERGGAIHTEINEGHHSP
jgi:hypothetical protein